jgi:hypothetical protein
MYITDGDHSQRAAFVKRIVDELTATGRRVGLDHAECFRRIDEL